MPNKKNRIRQKLHRECNAKGTPRVAKCFELQQAKQVYTFYRGHMRCAPARYTKMKPQCSAVRCSEVQRSAVQCSDLATRACFVASHKFRDVPTWLRARFPSRLFRSTTRLPRMGDYYRAKLASLQGNSHGELRSSFIAWAERCCGQSFTRSPSGTAECAPSSDERCGGGVLFFP